MKATPDGDVRLFLWEKFVGSPDGKPAVLFVHGSSMASQPTFDLTVPGRAGLLGDGLVRPPRLRLLVRRHGRLRTLRQDARHLLRHRATAPTTWPPRPTTSRDARRPRVHDLRHLVGRAARGALRAAPPRPGGAPRARRLRLDRRGRADARRSGGRSCPQFLRREAPADRPCVRLLDLRARPSGLRGAACRRRVRRRDPGARRLDAERHLHRHVLEAAGGRPGADHRADARAARPVRRHRRFRRPDRVLQAAAEPRQAVLGAGGNLARELPAEELPDGLPHPARVLHAAAAGVRRAGA